jgi:hypothetical protein
MVIDQDGSMSALAHRVISLLRSNLVASGVKRTSITEPDL